MTTISTFAFSCAASALIAAAPALAQQSQGQQPQGQQSWQQGPGQQSGQGPQSWQYGQSQQSGQSQSGQSQSGQGQFAQSGQGQSGQGLGAQEVRGFFRDTEQKLTQAVQSGDASAVRQWVQQHVGDSAYFTGMVEMSDASGGGKQWQLVTGDKQAFMRRQQAMMAVAPNLLSKIKDYELYIRVQNVTPIAPGVSQVRTRIEESGNISGRGNAQMSGAGGQGSQAMSQADSQQGAMRQMPQMQMTPQREGGSSSSGAASGSQGAGPSEQGSSGSLQGGSSGGSGTQFAFDAIADCHHIVYRTGSGPVMLGMTTCQGQVAQGF